MITRYIDLSLVFFKVILVNFLLVLFLIILAFHLNNIILLLNFLSIILIIERMRDRMRIILEQT